MCTSRLVVVRAITAALQRAGLEAESKAQPVFVEVPWGDRILERIAEGSADMGIYNETRGRKYIKDSTSVRFAGTIGHSMGGKNFGIIVSAKGPWAGMQIKELRTNLADASIVVGRDSDRFDNLLDILGIDDTSALQERNLSVVDVADAPCSMLRSMPTAVMVAGQNRRFEAREDSELVELDGFADLEEDIKSRIRQRSANGLFISDRALSRIGMDAIDILQALWGQVSHQWTARSIELVNVVADGSEFDDFSVEQRRRVVEEIVYATYRFGTPR
jgi:hypothetical protein